MTIPRIAPVCGDAPNSASVRAGRRRRPATIGPSRSNAADALASSAATDGDGDGLGRVAPVVDPQ